MSPSNREGARWALARLRPVLGRIARERDPEDRAASLVELWSGVEDALRTMLGGPALSGQQLVRELRLRELISLEQAHAVLDFLAVRERLDRIDYRPTDADVATATEAIEELEKPWSGPTPEMATAAHPSPAPIPPVSAAAQPSTAPIPPADPVVQTASSGRARRWPGLRLHPAVIAGGLLAILLIVGLSYWYYASHTPEHQIDAATKLMVSGQRDAATMEFTRIARENPRMALPHVFLSRLARDAGDLIVARDESEIAVRLEPGNSFALREMASVLYTGRQYEVARRFYVRAIRANPDDKSALGMLGCTLMHLNRAEEGTRFINRAGPGSWTNCLTPTPPPPPR